MKGRLFGTTDFPYLCTRHGILRVKRIRLIGTSVNPNQFQPSPEIPFKRTPLYRTINSKEKMHYTIGMAHF